MRALACRSRKGDSGKDHEKCERKDVGHLKVESDIRSFVTLAERTDRANKGLVSDNGGIAPRLATHAPVNRSYESCKSARMSWADKGEGDRRTDLSGPIEKVVLDVSRDGIDSILDHPLLCAYSGSRKVCLERSSAAVRLGHRVGVIRPNYRAGGNQWSGSDRNAGTERTMTENMHKLWMIFQPLLDAQDTRLDELSLQRILGQSRLSDVGSIETIHAVGTDDACLSVVWLGGDRRVRVDDDVKVPEGGRGQARAREGTALHTYPIFSKSGAMRSTKR